MSKPKVYIDGKEGTTGLQIYERLGSRDDIQLLLIDEDKRKDLEERRKFLNEADLVFLCLPDAAAKEAVTLIDNPKTRVIDASTAHRTAQGWVYGFAELLPGQRQRIKFADRVANPGCHATGFLSTAAPLTELGVLPRDYPVTCFSLTGYSGGGKKMIAQYEAAEKAESLYSPGLYGLTQAHKHLPEMQKISGLEKKPMFTPIVDDYYNGMVVCVPIQAAVSGFSLEPERVQEMLERHYEGSNFVHVQPLKTPAEMTATKLSCNDLRDTNQMEIFVFGDAEQILLCSRLDNLGKGASGAAVQCMNIMLGLDETVGLL